jgi:hypothetical protein
MFPLQQLTKSLNLIDCIVVVAVFVDCSWKVDQISRFIVEATATVFLRIVSLFETSEWKTYAANLDFSYTVFSGNCRYGPHLLILSRLVVLRQHNLEALDVCSIDLGSNCQI